MCLNIFACWWPCCYSCWIDGTIEHPLQIVANHVTLGSIGQICSWWWRPISNSCSVYIRIWVLALHPPPDLFLNSSAVPFVPCIRFLGLLDSELSWEPHLRWLCIKCRWSQNILKVLPGKSCLTPVYDALPVLCPICIKVGYVSLMCGSTVQNACNWYCPRHLDSSCHWHLPHQSTQKSLENLLFSCGVFLHGKAGTSTQASILWRGLHLTYR
jgi:hypothetical protein